MWYNTVMPMEYPTPADLLAQGLRLPPVAEPAYPLPPGTTCSITGQPIDRGYRVADMVTDATAEFLDCFRGGVGGHVSEAAARCFRSANPRLGNPCARPVLVFADGVAYMPTIARESPATLPRCLTEAGVTVERPCWSELVRRVWPARRGQMCLGILTTDTKKRLWIRARVGALGPRTPLLVYDAATGVNEVLTLDWERLLQCLELVEDAYTAGFPKAAIRSSLYGAVKKVGLAATRRFEKALAPWRGRPEFTVACLIAQKQKQEDT